MSEGKQPKERSDRLGQLRLLVALDALLREGSVSGAAASLGLQSSAVSRMLGQLRELYGDPLFTRTGKGLMPTPLSESLRLRLRALAAETENLVTPPGAPYTASQTASGWEGPALIEAPPLAVRPSNLLEGQPTPADFARKLARIGHNADPQRRLAKYIATIGTGFGRSRPLNEAEAEDALSIILEGDGDPIQIGALLSTMHFRGPTAAELAGFIRAARRHIGAREGGVDLDWPCYLSPKLRAPPWFIHAARLVAMAGHTVLLHGQCGQGPEAGKLEAACMAAGIPVCRTIDAARKTVAEQRIAYLPLAALSGQIHRLIGLYCLLETRLPLNIVVHLLNPLDARASLLGVAKPSHRELHRDIAQLLGLANIAILGNTRDFAQFTPFRPTTIFRLVDGTPVNTQIPMKSAPPTEAPTGLSSREYWRAVWSGAARDEAAETTIITTASVALMTIRSDLQDFDAACTLARTLWCGRLSRS